MCDVCFKYILNSLNKKNDNVNSSIEILSDENNLKISNELEESVITSNDELLKKARTKKELRKIGKMELETTVMDFFN